MEATIKQCNKCGQLKPLDSFSFHRKLKHQRANRCKDCRSEYARAYYDANRTKMNALGKTWKAANRAQLLASSREHYRKNADKKREQAMMHKYGLSRREFDALRALQNNACAICRQPCVRWSMENKGDRLTWFHVDHDHAANARAVRGLLCHRCNALLGYAKDDPARLQAAIEYLSCPPGRALRENPA